VSGGWRILVVDDEPGIRKVLSVMLTKEGCAVSVAAGRADLERLLAAERYDLVVTDMRMPDISGLEVLELVRERAPGARTLVMTAFPSADATIEAIQKGAVDYIIKEGDYLGRIRLFVRETLTRSRDEEGGGAVMEVRGEARTDFLIGDSPALVEIFKVIGRVAGRKSTVLITGESGTGKELVARAIHAHSPRRARPLVSINCGALTETLLESELFGHVKGSFTGAVSDKKGLFEAADGGTLFLDEIGETSKAVQVKLLRVLQEEKVRRVGDTRDIPVDVRIIAATNQDLAALIRAGAFREDIYFRLNVIPIHVPPLRERLEDLPKLVLYFLSKYADSGGGHGVEIRPDALIALEGYRWPGNVRELENVVERVVAMNPGAAITAEELPDFIRAGAPLATNVVPSISADGINLEQTVNEFEKQLVIKALRLAGGRRSEVVRLLGLTDRTLRYRLEKHGLLKWGQIALPGTTESPSSSSEGED
jgi:two-component system response regulator PilR (NtrC family)